MNPYSPNSGGDSAWRALDAVSLVEMSRRRWRHDDGHLTGGREERRQLSCHRLQEAWMQELVIETEHSPSVDLHDGNDWEKAWRSQRGRRYS